MKTIKVSEQNHAWLKSQGGKGESFNNIITRLCVEDARGDLEYVLEHIESGNPNWAINRLEEMLGTKKEDDE